MNKDNIKQFIKAFEDFITYEIYEGVDYLQYELRKEQSKMIIEHEIEQKAAELEVPVDYYIAEFM